MTKLTSKQESFIVLMTKSTEHARRGFDLLLKRPEFEKFFDAIAEATLFDPNHNPAPVPAGEPGFVRIPYWDALNYLEAVAKLSGEKEEFQLAEKVMTVVRTVSQAREPDQTIRDNYHTERKFAEILGLVPTAAVTDSDLNLIPGWLEGKFNRGMVGHALDRGAMRQFLASESPDNWIKACIILRHCTAIVWIDDQTLGENHKKPVTLVEDFWLKKLLEHHAKELGNRVGEKASEILLERIRETFDQGRRDRPSCDHRPAIENHAQNHQWLGPENRFVEGLRDVLLSWVDSDWSAAKTFIEALLRDETEIIRRLGIYVIDQRWEKLGGVFTTNICPAFFDAGHIHELYKLLRHNFEKFSLTEKEATLEAIRQLPEPTVEEDQAWRLKYIQRNWLSAIVEKDYEPANAWFNTLLADQSLGSLSEHPDFHSYSESFSGPGPSPYQARELLAFAELGNLIEKLNNFQQPNTWQGPTISALVDSLEEAIGLGPHTFLKLLPKFETAKRPFQYGIIAGFKRLWRDSGDERQLIDWNAAWPELIKFFERLIESPEFWTEQVLEEQSFILTPSRNWIPSVIADFIKAGTLDDKKAYSPNLLPKTWALLGILLEKLEMEKEAPHSDAMNRAINLPRGKVTEALFIHALRECRVSDQNNKEHASAWIVMKPIFDAELAKCKNSNFEFSTLAGNYISNLNYMDEAWLRENVQRIFAPEFQDNFRCAIDGLAHGTITNTIYDLLVEFGIIDLALQEQRLNRTVREVLIERIARAFILGQEQLNSKRFEYFFQSECLEDLADASSWFWSIRKENLTPDQIHRILEFLAQCVSWSKTLAEPPKKLLSSLSLLACYLKSLTNKERDWLLAVAPYVRVDYKSDFFLEELERLAELSPAEVSKVMYAFFDSYIPDYDFENRIQSILTKLAQHGMRKDAIAFTEKLRHLPNMIQLYERL